MRAILNLPAVLCTLAMLVVLGVLLHATSSTEALTTCQASHSADVCEFTLR